MSPVGDFDSCGRAEPAEITRYTANGLYEWHSDGVPNRVCEGLTIGGCRAFTVIVYLRSVAEASGGATSIRFADDRVVRVQPIQGTALFFHSYLRHRAEPLVDGHKAILNQWIRFRPMPWLLRTSIAAGVRPNLHLPPDPSTAPWSRRLAVYVAYRPVHGMLVAYDRVEAKVGSPDVAMALLVGWAALVLFRLRERLRAR